jgi:hypothetical protein
MAKGREGVWWRLEEQDVLVMYAAATLVWGMGGITAAGWALACSIGRPGKPVTMEAVT